MSTSAIFTRHNSAKLERIPDSEFSYICSRNQHQAHDLLMRSLRQSGLSQKQLSQVTGIDEATISRLLRRPRNVELNTLSKILFATCRAAISLTPSFPTQEGKLAIQSYVGRKSDNSAEKTILVKDDNRKSELSTKEISLPEIFPGQSFGHLTSADDERIVELENA